MHNQNNELVKNVIVVFGGAFNPPLNSHVDLAEAVLNKINVIEKVIFIPVNSKYNKQGLVSNEHRYNMLNFICKANENFLVSEIELNSKRQLYTIETLKLMKLEYPNNEIYFMMGSDNLRELREWNRAEELLTNFKIIVFNRSDDNIDDIIKKDDMLNRHSDSFIKLDGSKNKWMSSTDVRNRIKEGQDVSKYMPREVYKYIKENKLYL